MAVARRDFANLSGDAPRRSSESPSGHRLSRSDGRDRPSLGQFFVNGVDYDPVMVWDVGASALGLLFAGGRLRAQVNAATAQRDQAAFAYRGAALKAFGEVETALSGVSRFAEQIEWLYNRRQILIRSVAMARNRYRSGYASYLEQLDAQRNLYSTEFDAIGVRQNQLDNIITLYRALGRGWSAPSPATANAALR